MQFALSVVEGKSIKGGTKINNYLKTLNGNYTVDINEENSLATPKDCQKAYFFKLDLVVSATGDERYVIHERFKKHINIASTKEFTVTDWRNFIKEFQNYIFQQLDIIV